MSKNWTLRNVGGAIAVILLLALVVLPLVRFGPRSPSRYKGLACLSHMRGLSTSLVLYRNANAGEWPQGRTSAEYLGKLYPDFVGSLDRFSCPTKPTKPRLVDGAILDSGYLMDTTLPEDPDPLRVILGDRRGNHPGGANLLFADGHIEYVPEVNGLLPNPHIPEDTDVYSQDPWLDHTKDCDLQRGVAWRPNPETRVKPTCQSNLRNLSIGFLMYTNFYDGAWPQGRTSAECLGKLYPDFVESLDYFSCPDKPTRPRLVDGEIIDSSYLMDIAVPADAAPLRVVLVERRGNHPGGANLLFADGHVEYVEEVNGLLPNPYIPEDTDVYSDQPDLDGTLDCNLGGGP